jgi:ubiquinone/menaquinone biosynthesis C-methylase UbiE
MEPNHLFTGAAAGYERGRHDYPAEFGVWLRAVAPPGLAVDLAAGTGKLSRHLRGWPGTVIGVDPSAEMLAGMRRACPGIPVLRGTAEAIPLRGGSARLVTVGQAFHWFHLGRAVPEIGRVLAPGGSLVVAWLEDDRPGPFQTELHNLVAAYNTRGLPSHRDRSWHAALCESALFAEQSGFSFAFTMRQQAASIIERVCSTSFVGLLDQPTRVELISSVTQLCAAYGNEIRTTHRCCAVRFVRR